MLIAPLRALDRVFENFAERHGLPLTKNGRNWPDRSLQWGQRPELLIQLYMESETNHTYTMWVTAWDHRSRAEYWLGKTLIEAAPLRDISERLEDLLADAYEQAETWRREYLRDD